MKKLIPLLILVVIVAGLAYYFSTSVNPKATADKAQTDFAIADTSDIGAIFIADRSGNTATLNRTSEGWTINDKYPAREDAVALLLKTFKNIYIQRPVPKEGQEQVNRVMSTGSNKVEIYDLKGDLIKTWYVGHATMDKKGTYMLLETPKGGRSEAAYIMDMRGFLGMLNTRFFTNESEWRSTGIIKYPDMNLEEIEVIYPNAPEESFKIVYNGGNDIELYAYGNSTPVPDFDTTLVKDYMLNFKVASFENYETGLSPASEDSVVALIPYQIIRIKDPIQQREIKIWKQEPTEGEMEVDGETPAIEDRERVYAICDNRELAVAQRFAWDKFRAPFYVFLKNPKK